MQSSPSPSPFSPCKWMLTEYADEPAQNFVLAVRKYIECSWYNCRTMNSSVKNSQDIRFHGDVLRGFKAQKMPLPKIGSFISDGHSNWTLGWDPQTVIQLPNKLGCSASHDNTVRRVRLALAIFFASIPYFGPRECHSVWKRSIFKWRHRRSLQSSKPIDKKFSDYLETLEGCTFCPMTAS